MRGGRASVQRSTIVMRREDKQVSRRSTGIVPGDISLPPGGAHLLIRADLLLRVQKAIAERRLTQTEIARMLGVSQPRVSDLVRGRIELFSTDVLIDMLARLGIQIRFVRRSSARS
jgi:predicted XRE-type DNA-binding protein